jgi:hypothetical protein
VYAVGTPIGLDLSVARGIVSHTGRRLGDVVFLQTDLAVNPGNSGGPLLDEYGRVVGVVTAKATQAEGIGFAAPIEYAGEGFSEELTALMRRPDWVDGYSPAMRQLLAKAPTIELPKPEAGTETVLGPDIRLTALITDTREVYAAFDVVVPNSRPLRTDHVRVSLVFAKYEVDLGLLSPERTHTSAETGRTTYQYEAMLRVPSTFFVDASAQAHVSLRGIGESGRRKVQMVQYGRIKIH